MLSRADQLTVLLRESASGDTDARERLYRAVYPELRRLARQLRRRGAGETLATTALVHEAYLKLAGGRPVEWQDRTHFFGVAARAMRQVIVDSARRRLASKRGAGHTAVSLDEALAAASVRPAELLALDEALDRLERISPRRVRIVESRFFAGLTAPEIAEFLSVSVATVEREWRASRAWLATQLRESAT
jgi:RNA polymerase sigma factor (TIGR02999 family)